MRNQGGLLGFLGVLFVASLASTSVGCGDGGSCGFKPCGGNVVGSWAINSSCVGQAAPDPACPGATSNSSGLLVRGTMNFAAGMTYSTSLMLSGTASASLPTSCLGTIGMPVSCVQLNALLTLLTTDPTSPVAMGSCSTVGSNCGCSLTFRPVPIAAQGSYSTSGNIINLTPLVGTPNRDEYCVTGDTMKLMEAMVMPGMATMTMPAASSLTLARQ